LVDRLTGKPITDATHGNAPGPAASARVQRRLTKPRNATETASAPAPIKPGSRGRTSSATPK
jgi:hypothetical protein